MQSSEFEVKIASKTCCINTIKHTEEGNKLVLVYIRRKKLSFRKRYIERDEKGEQERERKGERRKERMREKF